MPRGLPDDFDPMAVDCDWDDNESIAYAVAREAYRRGVEDAALRAESYMDAARQGARVDRMARMTWGHRGHQSECIRDSIRALLPDEEAPDGE